jgi:hypothetical protein
VRAAVRGIPIAVAAALVLVAGATPALASHGQPSHWDRTGPAGTTAVAQMYMEDHTGANWKVNANTLKWNDSPRIGMYYTTATGCNHATLNCIPVHEGSYGQGWFGLTTFSVNTSTWHIVRNSMLIRFNNTTQTNFGRALTAAERSSTVCHELGHGTGVFNDNSRETTSCMYGTAAAFPPNPSTHDFNVIATYYNH